MIVACHGLSRTCPATLSSPGGGSGSDHGRRGRPARPRSHPDHLVRRAGDGTKPGRRWGEPSRWRGRTRSTAPLEGGDEPHANERVLRYLAKLTINPALVQGSPTTSARSRSASSPTSCCGGRPSSASCRSWCSRPGSRPGESPETPTLRRRRGALGVRAAVRRSRAAPAEISVSFASGLLQRFGLGQPPPYRRGSALSKHRARIHGAQLDGRPDDRRRHRRPGSLRGR